MKLVAVLAAFATVSVAPAMAARLKCSDRAVFDYVNNVLLKDGTWENGEAANSHGLLRMVGTSKTESTSKKQLVCVIRIQHTYPISSFPTSGTTEVLRARIWVDLHPDGTLDGADLVFVDGSK